MSGLIRKRKFGVFLTTVATVLLVGLLSPPASAGKTIEQRKMHLLEVLGLDVLDPTVIRAAQQAHTLYAVDVLPDDSNIIVVLQLSGLPTYDSSLYKKKGKFVVDLHNTINLSPAAEYSLGKEDPIRKVRNSQYRVSPALTSRVVLDLDENALPEIRNVGNNLIISSGPSEAQPAAETMAETGEKEAEAWEPLFIEEAPRQEAAVPNEVVSVPAVEVDTETPEVDLLIAQTVETPITEEVSLKMEPADVLPEIEESPAVEEQQEAPVVTPQVEETPVEEVETPIEEDVGMLASAETAEAESEEIPVETTTADEEPEISEPLMTAPAEPGMEMPEAEDVFADVPDAETVEIVNSGETSEDAEQVVEAVPSPDETGESEAPLMLAAAPEETEAEPMPMAAPYESAEETPVAAPEEPTPTEVEEQLSSMMADFLKGFSLPEDVEPAEVEAQPETLRQVAPEETLVTLTFREADLSAVLDILARKGNFNILAGKDVSGVVTVRLVDVPLDVAMNAILNVNGYGYIRSENIVRILPLSQLGEEIKTSTETYTLSYADSAKAKATLQEFLTPNGNIQTDERTNMIIVTDVPGNMDRIRNLIPKIDRRVQQVLIEVLILDSVLTDDADLGISWGLLDTKDNSLNTRQVEDEAFPDQLNVTLPVGVDALTLTFGTLLGDFNLNGFIEALVNDSDSRVLANPKVLTLNNETATIEIIEEFPYNDVTQTSSGGQLSNITFKEIGTKLDVKPQITHDEHVILRIAPEQNSIAGTTITGVPIIDTRRAETTLIVRNHQTIVLGGLRESRTVKGITKVPLLGDLPGVKYAFRNVQSDKRDTELLVFITVHIVESPPLLPEEEIKFDELANMPRKPGSAIELIR